MIAHFAHGWALSIFLLALAVGCSGDSSDATPARLRVGVLPDNEPELLRKRYKPLVRYLEEAVGIPCELIVPESYEAMLESFRAGDIDLAYFGGYTFVAAHELAGAVPLVQRHQDRRFVSYFLISPDHASRTLEETGGMRFAFGSRLSTSGHLMPRHFMLEMGIEPEHFYREVLYADSHDATVYAVRDGKADVGVANSMIVQEMRNDGRLNEGDVRILSESPPYADYVWAMQPGTPDHVRNAVLDAFLALCAEDEEQQIVLSAVGAESFFPATVEDYDDVAAIMLELKMLEELR